MMADLFELKLLSCDHLPLGGCRPSPEGVRAELVVPEGRLAIGLLGGSDIDDPDEDGRELKMKEVEPKRDQP